MMTTKDFVSRMNAVRKEKQLTCQDIVAITEQNGEPVSLSTVRRVFADDPGNCDFRRDNTLAPIARALGISLAEPEQEREGEAQSAMALLKESYDARAADLWASIQSLRRDNMAMIIIIILLLLFVFYLFADGLHGDWGFFRCTQTQMQP